MQKKTTMEQKLADWELAFNSITNKQDVQSLKGLIEGLRVKTGVITPGVTA